MASEDWITTQEAVNLSGYNLLHLRRLIRSGQIYGRKWGQAWQVSRQSLLDYLAMAEQSGDKRRGPK